MPDVFWMHSNQQSKFASNNVLLDITDKIKGSSIVDMNMFPAELVDLYKNDGKLCNSKGYRYYRTLV